jgi:hypothetical protein
MYNIERDHVLVDKVYEFITKNSTGLDDLRLHVMIIDRVNIQNNTYQSEKVNFVFKMQYYNLVLLEVKQFALFDFTLLMLLDEHLGCSHILVKIAILN